MDNSVIKNLLQEPHLDNLCIARVSNDWGILFRQGEAIETFYKLSHLNMDVFVDVLQYCAEHNLPVTVTNANYGAS